MISDFEEFSIPDVIHYIYFPILILEKEPVFSLLNVEYQTRELLVRLGYDAVLDWGLNPGPHTLEASIPSLGYRGGGIFTMIIYINSLPSLMLFSFVSFYTIQ